MDPANDPASVPEQATNNQAVNPTLTDDVVDPTEPTMTTFHDMEEIELLLRLIEIVPQDEPYQDIIAGILADAEIASTLVSEEVVTNQPTEQNSEVTANIIQGIIALGELGAQLEWARLDLVASREPLFCLLTRMGIDPMKLFFH
jgi:hypothetical protein